MVNIVRTIYILVIHEVIMSVDGQRIKERDTQCKFEGS